MIIHIITILFVILFWNSPVDITCFKKHVSLPLSLVILLYVLSVFSIFKFLSLFTKFSTFLRLFKALNKNLLLFFVLDNRIKMTFNLEPYYDYTDHRITSSCQKNLIKIDIWIYEMVWSETPLAFRNRYSALITVNRVFTH